MRPMVLPNKDTYTRSIARFTSKLKGKFKELAQARASPPVFPEADTFQTPGLQPALHRPAMSAPKGQLPAAFPGMQAAAAAVPGMQLPAAIPGMQAAAAVPGAAPSSAHNLLSGRHVAGFGAAHAGTHSSFGPSAGLSSAGGPRSLAPGHSAASPLARPVTLPYNAGQMQGQVHPLSHSTHAAGL